MKDERKTCQHCRYWGAFGKCGLQSGFRGIGTMQTGAAHILVTTDYNETCKEWEGHSDDR